MSGGDIVGSCSACLGCPYMMGEGVMEADWSRVVGSSGIRYTLVHYLC